MEEPVVLTKVTQTDTIAIAKTNLLDDVVSAILFAKMVEVVKMVLPAV